MFQLLCLVLVLAAETLSLPSQRRMTKSHERIFNGNDAADGEFPYQVSVRLYGQNHHCGGSIINENTVVSAAHCFNGFVPEILTLIVGTTHLSGKYGTNYKVIGLRLHEQFDSSTLQNDVSILRAHKNIQITNLVFPIALETGHVNGGVSCVVSGFGVTHNGIYPSILQRADLNTLTNEQCQDGHLNEIFDSQLCTSTADRVGTCNADSGGPLACNGKLAGIVSWGIPCAVGVPDVFTRVSSLHKWIESNSA